MKARFRSTLFAPQDRAARTSTKSLPAVQLRFDVANSHSLPEEVRIRLISLAGNQITEDGILIIDARRFRTQGRNREDATDRLVELIRNAAQRPKIRRKTRPTLATFWLCNMVKEDLSEQTLLFHGVRSSP
jgi:protein subunit release factor B